MKHIFAFTLLVTALPLMTMGQASKSCSDFEALIKTTYNFKPSKLSDSEREAKVVAMDKVWNAAKANRKELAPCLRAALDKPDADRWFQFDGSNLLVTIDPSPESKATQIRSYLKVDLDDVHPQVWVQTLAHRGTEGFDVSEGAERWLTYANALYSLPQHGAYAIRNFQGALFIYGSMDESQATPALVKIVNRPTHPAREQALLILMSQATPESLRALQQVNAAAFSTQTQKSLRALLEQPNLITPRAQPKNTRQEFLDAFQGMLDGKFERFLHLVTAVPDGEKDVVAVLKAEDITLVRKVRRHIIARGSPHGIEFYKSFTDILMTMIWKPDLLKGGGKVAAEADNQPSIKVGMVTRSFVDEKRKNWQGTAPRPLRTAIWYPAAATAVKEETIFGGAPEQEIFSPITVAPDAAIATTSVKYPLILLSHGTGGSSVQMMWLGYYLAAHGYIVAAVNHHGNTSAERERTAQGFLLYWERASDLTAVLDKVLADPIFGAHIDRDRIGAAGFSLGGYTVISIAGGVFSQQAFEAFCRSPQRDFTCEPQPEFPDAPRLFEQLKKTDPVVHESLRHGSDSYRDRRVKRVFAIAPALGSGFTKEGLSKIKIPVRIAIGQADNVTPLTTNAERYANLIKGANLTILPGGIGHYTFLAECTRRGQAVVDICRDGEGVDRAKVHQQVAEEVFQFFEQGWAKRRR